MPNKKKKKNKSSNNNFSQNEFISVLEKDTQQNDLISVLEDTQQNDLISFLEDGTQQNDTFIDDQETMMDIESIEDKLLLEITKYKSIIDELTSRNNNLQLQLDDKINDFNILKKEIIELKNDHENKIKMLTDNYTSIISGKDMHINSLNADLKKMHLEEEIRINSSQPKDEIQIKKENMIAILKKNKPVQDMHMEYQSPIKNTIIEKIETANKYTLVKQRRRISRF